MYLLAWPKLIAEATDSYGLTHLHLLTCVRHPHWLGAGDCRVHHHWRWWGASRECANCGAKRSVGAWAAQWYTVALFGSAALILSGAGGYELLIGHWAALPHYATAGLSKLLRWLA